MAQRVSVGDQMVDIIEPAHEIEVMYSNGNLWVNVDGICRLRCTRIKPEKITWNIDKNDKETA